MALDSLVAAKSVCELREWSVTNLELNKILYIAQMLHLGRHGVASPLVGEEFQAWDYGPVLPNVYHKTKSFGSNPVEDVFWFVPELPVSQEADTIRETVSAVKGMSAGRLVAITHWTEGAWAKHYRPGVKGIVIPNSEILAEYTKRAG